MEMSQAKKTILMKNPSILFLSAYEFLKLSFFLFFEILASFFTHFPYLRTKIHLDPWPFLTQGMPFGFRDSVPSKWKRKGEETPQQVSTNYDVGEDRVFCLEG